MFGMRFNVNSRSTGSLTAPGRNGGLIETTRDLLIRVTNLLAMWQERANARRRLGALDDRMLSDIGIDRATADAESVKPFWRS